MNGALRMVRSHPAAFAIGAVLALFLALACVYSVRTHAWDANDETEHVEYTEYLLSHGSLPPIAVGNGDEVHQPPLYYAVVGAFQRAVGIPVFAHVFTPKQAYLPDTPPQDIRAATPQTEAVLATQARYDHVLRLVSVALGALVVLCTFLAAMLVFGSVPMATLSALVVAVWPEFLVLSATVNNDIAVTAACAVALVCLLMWWRRPRFRWLIATAVALGAAALTKETALPICVAAFAAILWRWVRLRRPWWQLPAAAAVFVTICGWWYGRNLVVYGSPLAGGATAAYLSKLIPGIVWPHPGFQDFPYLWTILKPSFWFIGSGNAVVLAYPWEALWAAAVLCVVVALVFRPACVRDRSLTAIAGAFVLGGIASWLAIAWSTTTTGGRYILIAIPAIAILLVAGASRIGQRVRSPRLAPLLWPAALIALNVDVFAQYLLPRS
jgi:4-amino-4-deoxy-L-arabinose transferase-like glycosyltransferase